MRRRSRTWGARRDERADEVADEDRGTGESDRETRAEKEARADGAADGDHRKLAAGEVAMETLLALGDVIETRGPGHGATIYAGVL
jgi:hypothetical protein